MSANRKSIKSDLAKLDAMRDQDIDYSDIPELDDSFLSRVVVEWPKEKKTITIRLDSDVIDWLKLQGKGYQTRINAVLRAYMKHAEKRDNR